jgi:hypothetical protein
LTVTYGNTTITDVHNDFFNLMIPTAKHAQLDYFAPLSKLYANGGLKLFDTTLPQLGPLVFHSFGTVVPSWTASKGLLLAPQFGGDIGVVPFRGIRITIDGAIGFKTTAGHPPLIVTHASGGFKLTIDFDAAAGTFIHKAP